MSGMPKPKQPSSISSPLFPLGDFVATPAALNLLQGHGINPLLLIGRHIQGDWGNLHGDDCTANDAAVTLGHRILSSYSVGEKDRVWIITEHDRSSTCILLPSEY
ncbi:hypothetical protein GTP56_25135 [Duganella sp. FT134W]|uniref:Type I restriction endonuclease subunit M n=2 Tax=Duganella margarita TaxID=2692170 RepID=A0A7X4KKB4_9BURK|nr:hypothetical protein [Duganella margarita]